MLGRDRRVRRSRATCLRARMEISILLVILSQQDSTLARQFSMQNIRTQAQIEASRSNGARSVRADQRCRQGARRAQRHPARAVLGAVLPAARRGPGRLGRVRRRDAGDAAARRRRRAACGRAGGAGDVAGDAGRPARGGDPGRAVRGRVAGRRRCRAGGAGGGHEGPVDPAALPRPHPARHRPGAARAGLPPGTAGAGAATPRPSEPGDGLGSAQPPQRLAEPAAAGTSEPGRPPGANRHERRRLAALERRADRRAA